MAAKRPSANTQAARNARAALGCILAGILAATPLRADLAPDVAGVVRACLDDGQTPAARVARAHAAGWRSLSHELHLGAARALAPWDILRSFGLDRFDALGADALHQDLAITAENTARIIAANVRGDHWFALPNNAGYARIVDFLGDGSGAECAIAAEIGADDLELFLRLAPRTIERDGIVVTLFDLPAPPGDRGAIVSHIRLVDEAHAAYPILLTPRVPRPAPRAPAAQ